MLEALYAAILNTGIPVAYLAFPEEEAPQLPYICYFTTGTNNCSADGTVYLKINEVRIELYTKQKDFETESTLEESLSSIGFWEKTSESYIDSEKCYQTIYEMEV